MNILKAVFIAIIQGITEFLPVSSSGHILLLKNILKLDVDAAFDVALHMGTLVAVILIYNKEILELIKGIFKEKTDSNFFGNNLARKEIIKIWTLFIIATIPGGIAGLFLEKHLDFEPSSMEKWVFLLLAICFVITGIFLLSSQFINKNNRTKKIKDMNWLNAITIGIFQAFAILPGISRSGSTITASLYSKLNKNDAAGFSFILSIPLILAAFILKLLKLIQTSKIADNETVAILTVGMIISFIVGYFSLKFLIKIIQKGKLWVFSIYLIIPAVISMILYIF